MRSAKRPVKPYDNGVRTVRVLNELSSFAGDRLKSHFNQREEIGAGAKQFVVS